MRAALVCCLVLSVSGVARADSDSMFTFGFGSHTLVSKMSGAGEGGGATAIGQGFNARLKLLYVLGMEFTYDLISDRNKFNLNVQTPVFQWSGLLYLIPHRNFSLFLLAGLGATSGGDLMSPAGSTTSYHGGAGLEVGLGNNWMLTADFRVNLPGYSQVVERGKQMLEKQGELPSLSQFYNADSWQVNVGIRFYL